MIRYVVRRLVFAIVLVVVASSASLLLTRLAPGDITTELGPFASASEVAATRARFALDRGPLAQWANWAGRALRFDFGESFLYSRPVAPLVARAALNTGTLAVVALVAATLVGIGLGVFTGSRRGGLLPGLIRAASLVFVSMPPLVTSLLLVFVAARTGWFPTGGMLSAVQSNDLTWAAWAADLARHLPLPALALALPLGATFERLQTQSMSETVHLPFILAARAKGVARRDLIVRHAWPVSLRPICAVYGIAIGALLSGSFVVEYVTAWPGLGRLMYDALRARDIYLVAGCAAAGAGFLALGTLAGDLLQAAVDPRVRERPLVNAGAPNRNPEHGTWKRLALAVLLLIAFAAAAAPWVAPNTPARRFPDLLYAPPTQIHVADGNGVHAPFIYPWRLVSRLERRFEEDRTRRVPLRWFARGLVSGDADADAPLLLLGADAFGRDIFSRLVYGSRITLALALVAAVAAVLFGALFGGVAGYAGGYLDDLLSRTSELILVLPTIYVVLALRGAMPLALTSSAVFALLAGIFAFLGWPVVARSVRAIIASERQREYVVAAQAIGSGSARVLFVHLLPAARGHLATQLTLLIPAFILAEATMSYVGLGFPDSTPTWGTMLQQAGNVALVADAPWMLAPAAAIFVVVLAINVVLQSTGRSPVQLEK